MSARPEHTPAFDEQFEATGPHYRLVHPEVAPRRSNGHAVARRAPQAIARENGHTPAEWIEPPVRAVPHDTPALPRHALEATFQALAAGGARTLLATGPVRKAGTTSFVISAGRAIAGSGHASVVLVDANAQHPTLHRRLGLSCERGLTEALDELYGFDITREAGSQFGIGDWLEVLRAQGRTGQLTVCGDGRTYAIAIVRGRACALTSLDAAPAGRLGERLLQRGRITGEQREAAFRIHEETARPLGEVLSALGFVDPQDLGEALQQQCVRTLMELIALRMPECRFDERAESHVCGAGVRRFSLPAARGLDRLLRGPVLEYLKQPFLRSQTPSFLRDTDDPYMKVLVAGERACNLGSASRQAAFGLLLERLAQSFDFVLVDAPPAGPPGAGGLSPALAAHTDGVLLVLPARVAAGDAARGAIEEFRRAGARVLGVIMNRAGSRRRS
jgi:Mrp family chromosome partitioning ATPase